MCLTDFFSPSSLLVRVLYTNGLPPPPPRRTFCSLHKWNPTNQTLVDPANSFKDEIKEMLSSTNADLRPSDVDTMWPDFVLLSKIFDLLWGHRFSLSSSLMQRLNDYPSEISKNTEPLPRLQKTLNPLRDSKKHSAPSQSDYTARLPEIKFNCIVHSPFQTSSDNVPYPLTKTRFQNVPNSTNVFTSKKVPISKKF